MTHIQTLKLGVCMTALFSGSAAMADVTAVQVWENWKSSLEIYGEDGVTIGSEDIGDGTVTVTGIMLSMSDDEASVSADMGDIVFTENGDGTVAVTMAERFPITINDPDGSMISLAVSNSGLSLTASGDPDAINYELAADKYTIQLEDVTGGPEEVDGDVLISLNDVAGNYTVTTGDMRDITYALTTASTDILIDFKETESDDAALLSGKINGLRVDANIVMPEGLDFEDPDALIASGFGITASYGLENGNYIFDISDAGDQVAGSASSGAASVALSFDADRFSYDAQTRDVAVAMNIPDVPLPGMELPIDVTLGEYGVVVDMPLSKSEEPASFAFGLNLSDLVVNDEIWDMGDPTGTLPRDPATLKLDLTGAAKLFFDIMDPEQADAMEMADVPGEIYDLKLNEMLLTAVGAQVDGAGAFTFDNDDLETIPGLPRPEGEVTINITGANKLIDTLISMGLLPEDQAMGARMMMGMFARTVGDDQLSSTIEVNSEGHVIANGQRIQ